MMKSSLYKSMALHIVVLILIVVDLPLFGRHDMTLDQVPIIVDLDQVNISEMTNLPAKAEFGEQDQAATKVKEEKPAPAPEPEQPKPAPIPDVKPLEQNPEPVDETADEPKQDFIVPPQPSKPKLPDQKPEPKRPTPPPQPEKPKTAAPKKTEPKKPDVKTKPTDNMLKNLLDSVDSLEQNLGTQNTNAVIKEGTKVQNMGIEGGSKGSYFSELSISETDAIASRLRACWNLDPGAMGIEDMIVEIRAYLNKDGSVQKVDVLDSGRYSRDAHFRSVADSAKRAVYICAPYSILTQKYSDKYDMWKTMLLRFNPINHTVN